MTNTEPNNTQQAESSAKRSLPIVENFTRRAAVKGGFATLGAAAFVAAISPLRQAAKSTTAVEFMQQHYTELSPEQKADVIARLGS